MPPIKKIKKNAFTLIEVLLAISLSAIILVVASTLMTSIMEIWFKNQGTDNFQDHINSLSQFLETRLKESSYNKLLSPQSNLTFASPRQQFPQDPPMLRFLAPPFHPLLYPHIDQPTLCYLYFNEKEGLSLLYRPLYKSDVDNFPIYKRTLSSWVTKIQFAYQPSSNPSDPWEFLDSPKKSGFQLLLPNALKLFFKNKDNSTFSSIIYLPPQNPKSINALIL